MESFQQQQNNKIEFQGVKNTYPVGEVLGCYFTVPTTCKPEVGDWIGIFPVGWSTLGHCVCKKVVRPENCWGTSSGQYGKVEFEPEQFQRCTEQYYQFVYVKSGEYIRGASTPFMFVPFGLTNGEEQIIYKPYETVFGGNNKVNNTFQRAESNPSGSKNNQETLSNLSLEKCKVYNKVSLV